MSRFSSTVHSNRALGLTILSALAAVATLFLAPSAAHTATYYWDNNGTTAGFGTAGGTWGISTDWSTDSTGVAAPTVVSPTTSDSLNFGSSTAGLAAGTITVGTANAGNMTFASGSGAIVLSGGTITLAPAETITLNNAGDTISSVLAGAGTSLTTLGTGTLTLAGTSANTYTGTTIVANAPASAAVANLVLADTGGAAIAGNITFGNGSTTINPTINTTQSNQFGSGTVISFINGIGGYTRLQLLGNNQALAGLSDSIGAGVVQLGGYNGSTTANVSAMLTINGSGTYSYAGYLRNNDAGTGTGTFALVMSGSGMQTLIGTHATYTGGTTISAGTLQIGNGTTNGVTTGTYSIGSSGTLKLNYNSSGATAPTWANITGAGTLELKTAKTSDTAWGTPALPAGFAGFTGTLQIDSGRVAGSGATGQGLGGTTAMVVAAGGHFAMYNGGNLTIPVTIAGTGYGESGYEAALRFATNTLSGSTVTLSASATIGSNGTATISDGISGGSSANLTVGTSSLAGTVILSGANTYTGTTTINTGTLQFANPASLYNGATGSWTAANIIVKSGATFAVNFGGASDFSSANVATLLTNLDGSVTTGGLLSGSNIKFDTTNGSGTLSNFIANTTGTGGGAVGLAKHGANTLTLTGANTYTGATTISAGTLQLGDGTTGHDGTIAGASIVDNATLAFNRFGSSSYSGVISGTGAVTMTGTGTQTLSVANTFSGNTLVSAGTLAIGDNLALQNSPVDTSGAGVIDATGSTTPTLGGLVGGTNLASVITTGYSSVTSLTLNPGTGLTPSYSGAIADGAAGMTLTKSGAGKQTLGGANTYTGGTTISGGALQFAKPVADPASGAVAVQTGATLAVNLGGTGEWTTGTSGLGTVGGLLAGLGGQTGGTVTYAGAVNLGFDTSNNGGTSTYSGAIGNVGTALGITKLGANNLTLSGSNTYTGGTKIASGTLQFAKLVADPASGAVAVQTGATLAVNLGGTGEWTTGTSGVGTIGGLLAGLGGQTGGTVTYTAAVTLGFDTTNNGGSSTYSSAIGNVGTTLGITKLGANTLTLSGANTFSGNSLVSSGTLALGNNLALQNSPVDTSGAGVITVTGFTTPTLGGLVGSTNLASVITTGYSSVTALTLNPGTGLTPSYSGVIADGAAGMTLTKSGAGTQTLSGANTYTGATNVNGGTLALSGANNRLLSTGTLNFTGNSTFDVGATSQALSTLNVTTNSVTGNINGTGGGSLSATTAYIAYSTSGGQTAAMNVNSGTLTATTMNIGWYNAGGTGSTVSGTVTVNSGGTLNATTMNLAQNGANSDNVSGTVTVNTGGTLTATTMNLSYEGYDDNSTATSTINVNGILNVSTLQGFTSSGSGASGTFNRKINVNAGGQLNATTINLSQTGQSGTYNRLLTLNGGTLANLGSTNLTVDSTTPITLTGAGAFDASSGQSITVNGVVQSTGQLVKNDNGTLVLTNVANTYTGGTNINGGTLLLSGAVNMPTTGTLQVNAGGNFSLADATVRNTTTAALGLATGANLTFDWSSAGTVDNLTSTAAATTAGVVGIRINPVGTPTGTGLALISSASGGLQTAGSTKYYLANNTNFTATLTPSDTAVTIGSYLAITAPTTFYWQGNQVAGTSTSGVDNAWGLSSGTASNWSTSTGSYTATKVVPGSAANVIFSNTSPSPTQQTTVLGTDMTVNSVTINDATAVTIGGGNTVTLMSTSGTAGSSAITVSSTAVNPAISANVALGASQTWNIASGKTLTVSGTVSGAFGLTKADVGTLTLSGANTYTGTTNINAGTLTLGHATNTLASTGTVNFGGSATLDVGATNQSLANLTVANGFTGTVNGSGGTLAITGSAFTIGGATASSSQTLNMSGLSTFSYNNAAGSFNVGGTAVSTGVGSSGTMTLASANTITAASLSFGGAGGGGTNSTKDAGTLNLGPSNAINASTINVGINFDTALLQFTSGLTNPALTIRATDTISRANMTVGQSGSNPGGSATVDLVTGVTGTSTLDALMGTLTIGLEGRGSSGTAGPITSGFTMGGGTLDATTIVLGQVTSGTTTTSGSTLAGTFTTGSGTVKVGALTLGDSLSSTNNSGAGYAITAAFNLNGGGTLKAQTIQAGSSSGTAAKTRTFNWNNGTIQNYDASTSLTISGLTLTLANTGTHTFNTDSGRSITESSTAILAGAGGTLVASGSGTLTLGGANTYTGTTAINGGVLNLGIAQTATTGPLGGGTGSLPTGTISFGGGTLQYSSVNAIDYSSKFATTAQPISIDTNGRNVTFAAAMMSGVAGSLTYSDSAVTKGSLTLSGANTYSGATTVNSGTLVAGATNTLSASSAVSIAGGTLDVSGFTNTVPSLSISSGTLLVGLSNTQTVSNAMTVTGGTLAVSGGPTLGTYTLANYGSETGTFAALTGAPGYTLQYGTNALILQHLQDQAFSGTSPTTINIIAGSATTVPVSSTLTNTAPSGSPSLIISLTDASTGGTISSINSSASSPLAPGATSNVTGTFTAGATPGTNRTWSITNTDSNAATPTIAASGIVNVYSHSAATLLQSGSAPTAIVGNALTVPVTLADTAGATPAPLDVNPTSLSNLTGPTGSGAVASGATATYTTTALDTSVVGAGQTQSVSLSAGDSATVLGANGPSTLNATVTYNVKDHATYSADNTGAPASFTGGTLHLQVHAGGSAASSDSLAVYNGANGGYRVALAGSGTQTGGSTSGLTLSAVGGLGSGSSANISASITSASPSSFNQNFNYTFADDSNLSGASSSLGTVSINVIGTVYTGQSTWTGGSGGIWASNANWVDNTQPSVHAAPGLDSNFTTSDTATFGNTSGSVNINLGGSNPSLNALTFNSTGSYTISGGGSITLAGASPTITVAGTHTIGVAVALAADTAVSVTGGTDRLTISGPISGTQKLTLSGSGTLVLSGGFNSYGSTVVTSGTLRVANTTGSSATGTGNVTLNGGVLASGLPGSGGNGTVGGTVVAGTLAHTIAPGGLGTLGTLTVGALNLNGNTTLNFDITNTSTLDQISDNGALALSSPLVNVVVPTGLPGSMGGTIYKLIGFSSTGLTDASGFQIDGGSAPTGYSLNLNTGSKELDLIVVTTGPSTSQWNSGAGSWGVPGNWTAGVPTNAGDTAVFDNSLGGSGGASVTLDGSHSVGHLQFNNANVAYSIDPGTGGTLTIDNTATGATGVPSIDVTAGNHAITAPLALAAGVTVTAAGSTSLTISGGISGTGPLTKAGGGMLTLGHSDSYTGGTTVSAGTLRTGANVDNALGTGALVDNAAVNLGGNESIGTLGGSGSVSVAASKTLTVTQAADASLNGSLTLGTTGNGGTLALAATSTNKLTLTGSTTLGTGNALAVNGGTLNFNLGNATTPAVGANVTAMVASGATLELTGTVSALADPTALSSGTDTHPAQRVVVQNDGTLAVDGGTTMTQATQQVGGIDGGGSVTVADYSSLTADHINQTSLVIGNGSVFTLAPSDMNGNPMASGFALAGSLAPASSFIASSGSLLGAGSASSAPSPSLGGVSGASINAVPEPSTILLVLLGVAGCLPVIRRKARLKH